MTNRNSFGVSLVLAALALLSWTCVAGASTFVPLGDAPPAGNVVDARVVAQTNDLIRLDYQLGGYTMTPVEIEGQTYYSISLGKESKHIEAGVPELPNIARSVIIPDDAAMNVRVVNASYQDFEDVAVAPSKGHILRCDDPDAVPYTFGSVYGEDTWYPEQIATHRDPYIMRDYRGLTVVVHPFQYNPATRTLRVYDHIEVEVVRTGPGQINVIDRLAPPDRVNAAFGEIYDAHFLNSGFYRYQPIDEVGEMLVIAYDEYLVNMVPLVEWKNQMGIKTTLLAKSEIGTTATQFMNYIQTYYDTYDLAFVLLVGDAQHIPSLSNAGAPADPMYALVDGADSYPDIFIGRLSAESPAQVDLQVTKFVEYESMPLAGGAWYSGGVGIGSGEGAGIGDDGEADWEHMENIRTDLLGFTFDVVDQIYDHPPQYEATAQMVADAVNEGRSLINYCGHGSTTRWSTTGFSNAHVDALTNDNMLPWIISVACVNGNFSGYTCFAEAWLRAFHNITGEPTGAVGMYASTVNMSWAPPMAAQDETVDLLVAEQKRTYGALCYSGSCQMMDEYGGTGISEFKNWHIFGDPSLRVRSDEPVALTVEHEDAIDPQAVSFSVTVPGIEGALCGLSTDGEFIGSAFTGPSGVAEIMITTPLPNDDVTLTVTYFNSLPYVATVTVGEPLIPTLLVEPTSITVTTEAGQRETEYVYISNVGMEGSTLDFDLTVLPTGLNSWLQTDTQHGSVPYGETMTVTVTIDAGMLDEGIYRGSLVFESNGGDQTVNVTLNVVDYSGVAELLNPRVLALTPASPNPFAGATTIAFALPQGGPAQLGVYDMSGRLVRTLSSGSLDAGVHRYDWDGLDDSGRAVPGGVYLYRLEAEGRTLTGKVMALR